MAVPEAEAQAVPRRKRRRSRRRGGGTRVVTDGADKRGDIGEVATTAGNEDGPVNDASETSFDDRETSEADDA
jgi:hypothetical protein